MPLSCNIDAKGKQVRFMIGLVMIAIGLMLAFLWTVRTDSTLSLILAAIFLVVGVFCIFEARIGWCALRAMGIKTKV